MKKLFSKLIFICCIALFAIACNKSEQKLDMSKYEDLGSGSGLQLFAPDPALKNKQVIVPNPSNVKSWPSSGNVLNNVPQDILVKSLSKVSERKTYNIHDKFSRDYHFVGNSPVISRNKLFVLGNNSVLHAYNLSNLKELQWKKVFGNTEEDVFRGGGIFASDKYLAVTHGSNSVIILDVNTGAEKWKYMMSNISKFAPIIHNGMVFVLTVDNKLYCLDLVTGLLNWVNEGAAEPLGVIKASSIIAYKNAVIVPYSVGQVYAINISDGKLLWNLSLDDKFSSIGDLFTPIIKDGIAYISSFKGALYSLNLQTGDIAWSNNYAGGNPIWLAGDYIFSVNKNSQLSTVNKITGKVKWVQDLSNEMVSTGPILINKELFVISSNGSLIAFSPSTGKEIRRFQITKGRYANPVATSDGLFLLSEKGELLIF